MNSLQLVLLLLCSGFNTSVHCFAKPSLASYAIRSIIAEYFVKNAQKVDIIQSGCNHSKILVDELLRTENGLLAVKILETQYDNPWINQLNTSSIVAFDSAKMFDLVVGKIFWMNPKADVHPKHLVYIRNSTANELSLIIRDKLDISNVNFLLNESEESIDLISTHINDLRKSCRTKKIVTVNRFRRKTMQWDNSNFYLQEYKNLNGCTMDAISRTLWELSHFDKILNATSKSLNFTITYIINKEVTFSDASKFDLVAIFRNQSREFNLVPTVPIIIWPVTLTVPPGELYTPLEKMFLMFDFEVWIAIVATLLAALAVIQVINLFSYRIQDFFYGRNIRSPTLNLQEIFLTGGQFKVPGRNFARFLLILFIVWSLIIRTCYQSELYKYLQADIRKPRITRVYELFDHNFTFYNDDHKYASRLIENGGTVNYGQCKVWECFDISAEPANRATLLTTPAFLADLNNNQYRKGFSSLSLLEEVLSTIPVSIMVPFYSPFFEAFNEKIRQLHSSGLISYWYENLINPKGLKIKPEDIGPQVLTMEHVSIGFLVCMFPMALSILAFVGELAVFKLSSALWVKRRRL